MSFTPLKRKGKIKMTCNCNCNCGTFKCSRFVHRAITLTDGTTVALTTTNSDNINDKDPYKFCANARILNDLPETPVPVTVEVFLQLFIVPDEYPVIPPTEWPDILLSSE